MTVAEKLEIIAQNQPRLYAAAQASIYKDGKYLLGNASGKEIRLDDISPTEHYLTVRVRSDNAAITDLSGVTVTVNGGRQYHPSEDGTVEGVVSVYPVTELLCDTDGVIIDCEYCRDIDRLLDEYINSTNSALAELVSGEDNL